MKLLYITNGINGAGGLERVLSIKASYLAEKYCYDVTILTLNEIHPNSFYTFSPKVKLCSIAVSGNPISYINSYVKGIQDIVGGVQPDAICVCDDGLKGFFIPLILGNKIPIIYERHVSKEIEMHHEYPFWKKGLIQTKWRIMEYLGAGFSKFVVLTNGNLAEWKTLKNTFVLANPLSFYPTESSSLKNKKVIAVGKQGYQKGYDLLLQSWSVVSKKFPDWHLEIYGKRENGNKLALLTDQYKITQTVSFFDPEKNIQEKYLDAAVYVMSSRFEGFGMVLIEAMACGVPCVSFDCNYGPADIITNNEDGYLVENGNIDMLAKQLIAIIENDDLRKSMGKKAKENVKRFAPEIIAKKWDELFKELTI